MLSANAKTKLTNRLRTQLSYQTTTATTMTRCKASKNIKHIQEVLFSSTMVSIV